MNIKKTKMKKIYNTLFVLVAAGLFFSACKKDDYFVGGTLHNAKVNMTTYDFLKSNNRGLFDTLLLLVDKAGIKDKINKEDHIAISEVLKSKGRILSENGPLIRLLNMSFRVLPILLMFICCQKG